METRINHLGIFTRKKSQEEIEYDGKLALLQKEIRSVRNPEMKRRLQNDYFKMASLRSVLVAELAKQGDLFNA